MKKRSVVPIVLFLCLGMFFVLPGTASAATKNLEMSQLSVTAATTTSVSLSWKKVNGAYGYYIYRASSKNGTYQKVAGLKKGKIIKYTDTGLSPSKTYYYKARVRYSKKYCKPVKAATKSVSFSDAKPAVTVAVYKSGSRVKWKAVSGATSYRVYRASSSGGSYSRIGTTSSSKLYYTDYSGTSGKTYYYKVRAAKWKSGKYTYSRYCSAVKFRTVSRVFVACGHGTDILGAWDSGCTYKSMSEAGLMLPITKSMVKYLRASGVYVYTDADANNNKNMLACVKWANKKRLSAYMSIHCDWRYAPTGTLPLYKSSADKKLAQALNKGVRSNVSIATRGLSYRWDLYELSAPKAPAACIFETGSISKDYKKFKKHDAYGKGLAKGMCSYLGVKFAD